MVGDSFNGFVQQLHDVVVKIKSSASQIDRDAARNTADMIDKPTRRARNGVTIANAVSGVLDQIVDGTQSVSSLVSEIAAASRDQSDGIGQINVGMSEIDRVTQQGAGHAEELAATASETTEQARELTELVEHFRV